MKILFASKNKNKFKEIREIFKDSKFEIIFDDDLEDVVEDKDTILGNAQKKSEEIFLKHNIPVLSDDSGLFVEALGNLPGVSTARYAGENASDQENIERMLKNLSNEENRKAQLYAQALANEGGSAKDWRNNVSSIGTLINSIFGGTTRKS